MKVVIDFSVTKKAGGAYQYCTTFLDVLLQRGGHEYFILNYSPDFPEEYRNKCTVLDLYSDEHVVESAWSGIIRRFVYRTLCFFHLFFMVDWYQHRLYNGQLEVIKKEKPDIVLFPAGSPYAPYLDIPYITTIYDLEHRKHPNFPEVSRHGTWHISERYYKRICATATRILVDSEVGKEDVLRYYDVPEEHIVVLPYLPPAYLQDPPTDNVKKRVHKENNVPERFLFYPAQFWSHKNHINLLKAILNLREKGLEVPLMLTGSKKEEWGEFQRVMKFIDDNTLGDIVCYLGYVEDDVMLTLYSDAVAMTMPTLFGPTNIPVLEAWSMKCPVIYSDISGCREQLGNAGLLVDPHSPQDIAEKIEQMWNSESLREELKQKGTERLSLWTYEDFSAIVSNLIDEQTKSI